VATAVSVTRTNNPEIDGLLGGTKWTGTVTYSFPDSPSDYLAGYSSSKEPTTGFSQAPAAEQAAINYAVGLILSYTNASIQYAGTNSANIQIAQSSAANPTSYAYYPSNSSTGTGGDVWFGNAYDYSQAKLGNYYFTTALHELGHAFGLKHSQETGGVANVAVPAAHDDSEFTVMSYRSYVGGPLTGYTNEAYGFPDTYMANDILALQTLYGANFSTHAENTVYSWNPATGQEFINGVAQLAPGGGVGGSADRVFMTVWDGNGVDTYDMSNYSGGVSIDLNPGASSITSAAQLAYLGNGHYAQGNVFNAYLYNGDPHSYIDNAIGGAGNDTLKGNAIANSLDGGAGDDTLAGGGGNDTIIGGSGTDTAVFSGSEASYSILYNAATASFTVADQRAGTPDGSDTVTGVENFQFSDGTFASSAFMTIPLVPQPLTDNGIWTPAGNGIDNTWHVGDFNGDGKADIFRYLDGEDMFLSNGASFSHSGIWSPAGNGSDNQWHVGDFNGDGKDDIFRYLGGTGADMFLSDGTSFVHDGTWTPAGAGTDGSWQVGDFNGDGKADIFRILNGADVFLSDGTSFVHSGVWSPAGTGTDGKWYVGDFNGDGKSDIFRVMAGSSGADMFLSNGVGFVHDGSWTTATVGSDGTWHVGDLNGDGKADIFRTLAGQSGADVFLSNGSSFVHDGSWTAAAAGTDNQWYVGDFNGHGADDVFRQFSGVDMLLSHFG
jgi:hypothetical protein